MTALPPAQPRRIGRVHRARLLQPARFYLYGWSLLLLLTLAAAALVVGEWQAPALAAAAVLLMGPGIEAAARSTLGPADVLRAAREHL